MLEDLLGRIPDTIRDGKHRSYVNFEEYDVKENSLVLIMES